MAHFIACTEQCDARAVAGMFVQYVFRLHGLPDDVVSDRGPQFRAVFWRSLLSELGVQTNLSSSHHPQSDGQTERVNQVLEQYLRCYVDYQQDNWSTLLPLAEFAYNNSQHASTRMTPFFALTGMHPRADLLEHDQSSSDQVSSVDERLAALRQVHGELSRNMSRAQQGFKKYADRTRQDHKFAVGEKVWLLRRHQPTERPCDKLDFKRLGPYKIIEKITPVAFRLELPSSVKIHDVFHTSMLEPYHESTIPGRETPLPPPELVEDQLQASVDSVLDSRLRRGRLQYLVSWRGYGTDNNTWVGLEQLQDSADKISDFHSRYPQRPALYSPPQPCLPEKEGEEYDVMNDTCSGDELEALLYSV